MFIKNNTMNESRNSDCFIEKHTDNAVETNKVNADMMAGNMNTV